MGPKKDKELKKLRRKTKIAVDVKKQIIAKYENGVRVSELSHQFGMPTSTICSILKNREVIKKADVAMGVSVISKQRTDAIEKVEKLLLIWINDNTMSGKTVTETMICKKARQLHGDLVKRHPNQSGDAQVFKASRGWLQNFKKRTGILGYDRHEDTEGAANQKDSNGFRYDFNEYVTGSGFAPQQVFNCDKMNLYWKRMPKRTHITIEEKALPGHKPMKDKLSLLLCGNASGDFKIKPLLVYHSENPRAFKKNHVIKSKLPVMWRANTKGWITRQYFIEWIHEAFAPSVKKYLEDNNLPVKCLLAIGNASIHLPGLADELMEELDFITVMFLPLNFSLAQPLDHLVFSNFKRLYTKALFQRCFEAISDLGIPLTDFWKHHFNIFHCLTLIDKAWGQVTCRTMNLAWALLWPECITVDDSDAADHEDSSIIEEIVSLGRNMGLEVNAEDVEELLEDHKIDLTAEDLEQLKMQLQTEIVEEMSSVEDGGREEVPTSLIQDICAKWGEVQSFVEFFHPDKAVASRSINMFNDGAMWHFRNILRRRQSQIALNNFSVGQAFNGTDMESIGEESVQIKIEIPSSY